MNWERISARITQLPGARSAWLRLPLGSVATRTKFGIWRRPHYAYGVYSAARMANRLGISGIAVMEFGVAGGRGLLELEDIARRVSQELRVRIDVFGFDSGQGLPEPVDYRDLPYVWAGGYFKMDRQKLQQRLQEGQLLIGDIADTLRNWRGRDDVPPVGFVAFDLDYYSSTKKALTLFEGSGKQRLPRVFCYFDDIISEEACHNEYVGELCAIREFNEQHDDRKICPLHMLRHCRIHQEPWCDQVYVFHEFHHPLYCKNLSSRDVSGHQLPL